MNKQDLNIILKYIDDTITEKIDFGSTSKLNELWGVALYFLNRYEFSRNKKKLNKSLEIFEKSISKILLLKNKNAVLHDGLTGYSFTYNQLVKKNIIERDFLLEVALIDSIINSPNNIKLDLFDGSLGNFIVTKNQNLLELILNSISSFFDEVNTYRSKGEFSNNISLNDTLERYYLNVGLAHGWASKLSFLSTYGKISKKYDKEILKITQNIYNLILESKSGDSAFQYPTFAFSKKNLGKRLAWCHNDLGIAYSLLTYSNKIGNSNAKKEAIKIIDKISKEEVQLRLKINDPYICHGSMGIALIYFQIYLQTKNLNHIKLSNYWKEYAIEQLTSEEDLFKYEIGFLQGLSGVGLSLIYMQNPQNKVDWLELIHLC